MKRPLNALNAAGLILLLLLGLATFGVHTWQHVRWEGQGSAHQAYHADEHAHVQHSPSSASVPAASEKLRGSSIWTTPAQHHDLLPEHVDPVDGCLVCILHSPNHPPFSTVSAPFRGDLRVSSAETDAPPSHHLGSPDIRGPPVTV